MLSLKSSFHTVPLLIYRVATKNFSTWYNNLGKFGELKDLIALYMTIFISVPLA
jgi:hypothetical protein